MNYKLRLNYSMKKTFFIIALVSFFGTGSLKAQDFKEKLRKTFLTFDSSQNQQLKLEYSNKLGLISKKWNEEWAAHYYNAYAKASLSYRETDEAKRDAWLDEAEKEMEEAVSLLKKENDETHVLAAMIANARMAVKPMTRWQKYGAIFEENLSRAKEINPDNPRIYYLMGTSKFYTPKAFGGGKKAALPYFEKAGGLFEKETNEDIIRPYWGKHANEYFLAEVHKGEEG
jgi:hypothetical protein